MAKKEINNMTRKELIAAANPVPGDLEVTCDSLILVPMNEVHDSGYRCMGFIGCVGDDPKYFAGGGSDVVHLNGIGGFGLNWTKKYNGVPSTVPPVAWNMDCLAKSGLMRLFVFDHKIRLGVPLSSFEIFPDKEGE